LQSIQSAEMSAVMGPYVMIAFVILGLWLTILLTRFPSSSVTGTSLHFRATLGRLLRTRHYVLGVVAQFFYVGAQIGVWSFTIRYAMANLGSDEASAANYYLAAIVLFSASRFVCTALMRIVSPRLLLVTLAALAAGLSIVVISVGGPIGVYALVGVSGCMSLMFPTIYGLAVEGLGDDAKIAASGLIMAILGGAVITAIQGQVSDLWSIHASFSVPLICFLVILVFGFVAGQRARLGVST
jgi:MFS transporter, FHS family, L-fucose permease